MPSRSSVDGAMLTLVWPAPRGAAALGPRFAGGRGHGRLRWLRRAPAGGCLGKDPLGALVRGDGRERGRNGVRCSAFGRHISRDGGPARNGATRHRAPDASGLALERLDLSDNALAELVGIEAHARLRELDLSDNRIGAAGPLAALTALERPDLSGNRVTDIAPLAGLAALRVLVLDGNAVSDLGPMTHLASLEHLALAATPVPNVASTNAS